MSRGLALASLLAACAAEPTPPAPPEAPPGGPSSPVEVKGHVPENMAEEAASPGAGAGAPRRHTVTVAGHPIALYSKRPARPWASVVLVHGRTWSALPDFDLQVAGAEVSLMDGLVAAGVAAYAIDLRGYGATPRDPSGFSTPLQAADDLAAALRFVAGDAGLADRPAVLGWSLGARVAALAGQRHPDLIGALILYGTPCSDPRARPRGRGREPEVPERRANTEASARSDFITPGAIDPAVADAFVAAALAADPVRADWREVEAWRTVDFRALRAPILAIHGERDPVVDAACVRARLAEAPVPTALEVLPGADHAAHLERAGPRFVAAAVAFLRTHMDVGAGAKEQVPQAMP